MLVWDWRRQSYIRKSDTKAEELDYQIEVLQTLIDKDAEIHKQLMAKYNECLAIEASTIAAQLSKYTI